MMGCCEPRWQRGCSPGAGVQQAVSQKGSLVAPLPCKAQENSQHALGYPDAGAVDEVFLRVASCWCAESPGSRGHGPRVRWLRRKSFSFPASGGVLSLGTRGGCVRPPALPVLTRPLGGSAQPKGRWVPAGRRDVEVRREGRTPRRTALFRGGVCTHTRALSRPVELLRFFSAKPTCLWSCFGAAVREERCCACRRNAAGRTGRGNRANSGADPPGERVTNGLQAGAAKPRPDFTPAVGHCHAESWLAPPAGRCCVRGQPCSARSQPGYHTTLRLFPVRAQAARGEQLRVDLPGW